MNPTNRAALVTGSSRGIGRAVAAQLAREGYAVGINYYERRDKAEELAAQLACEGCRALAVQADVSKRDEVNAMVKTVEIEMLEAEERESIMKKAIEPVRDDYDYIIIDCSPSLGLITVNSLTAADSVMIPVQPEFFALEGLGKLLQTIRLVQNGVNPALTIEGFVVTMFDGRTKVHTQVLNQLREHFKDMVFNSIIQRNIRLSEAPSHGKPIILYDIMSNGTTNYLNLAKEVLEKNEINSVGHE